MSAAVFVVVVLVASLVLELGRLPRWSARRAAAFFGVLGAVVAAPLAAWGAF